MLWAGDVGGCQEGHGRHAGKHPGVRPRCMRVPCEAFLAARTRGGGIPRIYDPDPGVPGAASALVGEWTVGEWAGGRVGWRASGWRRATQAAAAAQGGHERGPLQRLGQVDRGHDPHDESMEERGGWRKRNGEEIE